MNVMFQRYDWPLTIPRLADDATAAHSGGVRDHAPIVVHPASTTGGRRVTARGQILGLAYSDADLIEFLRRAGLPAGDELIDDEAWVEWRGGRPRDYGAG